MGLTLVAVASRSPSVLVVAGSTAARERFAATSLTLRVDDLSAVRLLLERFDVSGGGGRTVRQI
jgi:hypothetical protein